MIRSSGKSFFLAVVRLSVMNPLVATADSVVFKVYKLLTNTSDCILL